MLDVLDLINKESISLFVGALSAVAGVIAVIISRATMRKQREMQQWIINHDLLFRAYEMLEHDPCLLDVYGIQQNELIKDGITPQELIFINAHLHASLAMARVTGEKSVKLTEQRKQFLSYSKVRIMEALAG